jgi:sec-independent protein translocase protein TatA
MGIENPVHLIFIAAVALIVLGPKRLPELARRLGQGVREFRDAIELGTEEHDHPAPAPIAPAATAEPAQVAAPASPEVFAPEPPEVHAPAPGGQVGEG